MIIKKSIFQEDTTELQNNEGKTNGIERRNRQILNDTCEFILTLLSH